MTTSHRSPEGKPFSVLSRWQNLSPGQRRMGKFFFFIFIFAGGIYLLLFAGLPDAEEIKAFQPVSTVDPDRLNWSKRTAAGVATDSIRLWVPLKRISPLLQKAVVISEDDVFYQHDGINYETMKEAFRVNWEKGRYVRGASTITMQLARNAFLHKRKTLLRKIRELILARRLEANLSKTRILELYLNIVEWGEGIYGAEAASRYYFGKSAASLNLAEATLLASMLPNPKIFNPFKRLKSVQKMQKRVVWLMENAREINAEQAQWALTDFTLRGGIAPPETVVSEADSLEEAKYFAPTPEDSIPTIPPHTPSTIAADSLAQPDSSGVADSSGVNLLR
jgi:monofunctional biosynthetic peptidoglycan transglycosylase